MNATHRILNRPLAEWPQAINASKCTTHELEADLAALVQRAALLHAYVVERYNTSNGPTGHDACAKRANRALTKIRKAMGFSIPSRTPLQLR